ncbi:hypothetical protein [Methylopila sp. Yamaguchi]|uniref:hypothetical protein n=1 Tax=Methylopila sp. Yamaguchi TaxID=1437817 RepID=UPI000CC4A2BC|nr:hypothetical protein [Methylopila sp. Yamaguchi]GBD47327.1 hypothetical protein METY_0540 [Methylopila sp. Yamaguchi]
MTHNPKPDDASAATGLSEAEAARQPQVKPGAKAGPDDAQDLDAPDASEVAGFRRMPGEGEPKPLPAPGATSVEDLSAANDGGMG